MDDSEDFTELCARLLKRVRKREAGEGKEESQPPDQSSGRIRQKQTKKDANLGSKASRSQASHWQHNDGELKCISEEAAVVTKAIPQATVSQKAVKQKPLGVTEKVVSRMQRFKRVSPQKLKPSDKGLHVDTLHPPREQDPLVASLPDLQGDETLALRLQQELDRELWEQPVDLEEKGLFFCQICQRDLSAMSPQCRAQHINRCLDESEDSAPPPQDPSQIPECPICGKGFKSRKSRATHLKRCSADMGVAPAVLMEALQRQAAASGDSINGQPPPPGRLKRKGSADPNRPIVKKSRKNPPALDEDTMVAMALSRSMLEQEKEKQQQAQQVAEQGTLALPLGCKVDPGKRRRKKRSPPVPPPLLLCQDPQDVLLRLQDRIAALLFHTQPDRPPTPHLPASNLQLWTGAAPLWQKSALQDGGPVSTLDFYTAELKPLIEPWVPPSAKVKLNPEGCSQVLPTRPADPPKRAEDASSPVGERPNPVLSPVPSQLVGSQTLCDLMDLAEEGMTLTQYGVVLKPLPDTEQPDPLSHDFIPGVQGAVQSRAPVRRLASDLASMVNNPQLSDVQLQVDSGDVFFTHSFMLYARCPLLAQMVHDSGFGVQEEGMPCVQRVLLGEMLSEAVLALLQYLYTGHCPLQPGLISQVQELAIRFDLKELQELCHQHAGEKVPEPWGEFQELEEEEELHNEKQNFMELLRSMWEEEEAGEEEENEVLGECRWGAAGSPLLGDAEPGEEKVDEDELEEIYEFAATQRKHASGRNSGQEEEEDVVDSHTDSEEGEELVQRERGDCMSQRDLSHVKARAYTESQGKELKNASPQELPRQTLVINCHSLRDGLPGGHTAETPGGQMTDVGMDPAVPVMDFCTEHTLAPHAIGPVGSVQSDSVHSVDTSLDKSYDRLFSESWGNYEDPCPSQPPHCSPEDIVQRDVDGITLVPGKSPRCKSSASQVAIIDLSVGSSPEPFVSSLSITSVSPGSMEGKALDTLERDSSPIGDTQVCHGHNQTSEEKCISGVPANSSGKVTNPRRMSRPVTPEIVVISDSGDEMDFSTGNTEAKPSFLSSQQPQVSHSVVDGVCQRSKAVVTVSPKEVSQSVKATETVNPEVSASCPHAQEGSSISPQINSSAEISWVIPVTPKQSLKATQTGSTQTYSSMCRTKLFSMSLNNKSKLSSSSLTSSSIPHTSVNFEPKEKLQPPALVVHDITGHTHITEGPASSSSSVVNCRIGSSSGLCKGDGSLLKSSNMIVLNSCLVGGPDMLAIRADDSPPSSIIPSSQLKPSRLTFSQSRSFAVDDADYNGIPLNASSTPLHPNVSAHMCANQYSFPHDNCNLGSNHKSPDCRVSSTPIPSRDEPFLETHQVNDPESRHLSLLLSSPQQNADPMVGESPDKHTSLTRLSCIKSSGMVTFSESKGNLREEVEDSSPPQQSFCTAEDPPIPFDDSWVQGAHFSFRLDSRVGVSPPEQTQVRERKERSALSPPAISNVTPQNVPEPHASMLDSKIWDDWEEEEGLDIPLSQRVCTTAPAQRVAQLKTPVVDRRKSLPPLEPITPMPGFSDMDTPELKNQLNKFGVRPLPKRQMILKLKEIHQYTHQLLSSDSEDEGPVLTQDPHSAHRKPGPFPPTASAFKEPAGDGVKVWSQTPSIRQDKSSKRNGDEEPLSASQSSTTSSTAASEDSDRSNPELCPLSDDASDSDEVTQSQAVSRDAAKLQAVRHFLQSDSALYGQILQYQPLVLAHLQAQLKAAGIRIGAAKLLDFLDSQCITFTTANPKKLTASRGRGPGRGRGHRRKRLTKALD